MRIRKWMYNLRLRDRFKRYSALLKAAARRTFPGMERESKGLLCSSRLNGKKFVLVTFSFSSAG